MLLCHCEAAKAEAISERVILLRSTFLSYPKDMKISRCFLDTRFRSFHWQFLYVFLIHIRLLT